MDALQSSINTNSASLASTITNVSSTNTTVSQSFATTTTNLTSTVNNQAATISQTATTLAAVSGSVSSAWTLNVVANSRVAGMKILNSGASTSFTIQADSFFVVDSSGNYATSPFSIVGGAVYINDAVIQSLSVNKLTAGTFAAATMTLGNNGIIASGQTSYNNGTGFYIGNNGGNQYFSIGNSAGSHMRWDSVAQTLYLTAAINAGSVTIDDDGAVRIARSGFQNTYDANADTRTIGFELGYWTEKNTNAFIDFHSTSGGDNDARIIREAGANGEFKIEQKGSSDLIIWHLGNTGGRIRFKNESYIGSGNTGTIFEHVVQASGFNTSSSRRLKTNISTLTGALDIVESVRGVNFDWIDGSKLNDIGFIAEEVNEVVPQLVTKSQTGVVEGVDYGRMTPILIEALKQLSAKVKSLESKLNG